MYLDNLIKKDSVDSTNEWAKRDFREDAVYIADTQTSGKGRGDNSWFSPKGKNIYFSMKFMVDNHKVAIESLFITSLAIAKAIKKLYDLDVEIKWPNDILINKKKVSGVLSELIERDNKLYLIIGVGINCNLELENLLELSKIATSLHYYVDIKKYPDRYYKNYLNRDILLLRVISEFQKLYRYYQKNGFKKILNLWNEYSKIVGRRIYTTVAKEKILVTVVALNDDGSLVVKDGNDSFTIMAGDIEYA